MSAKVARVAAQAKLNLGLRILARERGGYHEIETLFARLALADTVTVRPRDEERSIVVRGLESGPPLENISPIARPWRMAMQRDGRAASRSRSTSASRWAAVLVAEARMRARCSARSTHSHRAP